MDILINFIDQVSWLAILQIILIDILLGGDNAIVIALACRNLPPQQRTMGIIWGTVGAVLLRVVLIGFALELLKIDYLKLVGGLLLLWIGIQLLTDDNEGGHEVADAGNLWAAVKTILIADLVMSIDNVLAIAGAATDPSIPPQHQIIYVVFGILLSIPIVMWGSSLVLKLLDRFPVIVVFGAGLLGWIGGGMILTDNIYADWLKLSGREDMYTIISQIVGAIIVVSMGLFLKRRRLKAKR